MKCRALEPIGEVEARFAGAPDGAPRCQKCGGLLKPDAIFFGEAIPSKALMISQVQSQKCDLLLVIGTSLQVFPAAQIPLSVKLKYPPATVVEINREPSAMYEQVSDILLLGSASEILGRLTEVLEGKLMAGAC